ncbi:hypothetical protein QC764_122405 [Podospora pseudoanserina]|uniref:Subtelomeric hrmA-associated cluster protein AFUB-079030/YDR124W-like helical bundle domain-containing protein n=1 Tax=Podospora pseudoanserina TaxID=2609844 RepID=A0ABR0ISQ8_9PEZI|nr:hypothetical protein QC764_122405 [Podospora pseudoanserina]
MWISIARPCQCSGAFQVNIVFLSLSISVFQAISATQQDTKDSANRSTMEFEGIIPPAVIISSNTMAVDDELLPLAPAFLDLAYTSFDPYSHQASFPHHQPPDPPYGGGNHHQEPISLYHSAGMMLAVDPQSIGYAYMPNCQSLMPVSTPLQLPVQPSTQTQTQQSIKTDTLRIGDAEAVWQFYDGRFQLFEQRGCIILARILIKIIAPKKKHHYPYIKGDSAAPPWWPQDGGVDENDRIRHVDPSYIPKTPRIRLLVHLIRLITEPHHRQHPEIQEANFDIGRLESVVMETISTWFQEEPRNGAKRPILEEIFHVAKAEASFKAGQIDDQSTIHVWPAKTLRPKYRKRSAAYNPTANDFDLELPPDMSDLAPDPQLAGSVLASGSVPEVCLEVPPGPTGSGQGIPAPVGNAVSLPSLPLPIDMIRLPAMAGEYVVDNGQDVQTETYADQTGLMQYGYAVGEEEQLAGVPYMSVGFPQLCHAGENVHAAAFPTGVIV